MNIKKLITIGITLVFLMVGLSGCTNQTETMVKNKDPVAVVLCNLTNGRVPLTVSFNGSGNDSDGTIESYHWDFNDGYTSNDQKPTHTFSTDKKYIVIFTVTDNDGGTATESITITATKNNPPIASASSDKTSGEASFTIKLSGSGVDSDGTIESYNWDFGDGKTSSNQNPTYTFTAQGKFTVVLTVTDNEGATDTDTIEIMVCKWVKIESFNEPYYTSTPYFDINTDKFRVDYEIIPEEGTYSFPMAIFGIYPLGATWVGDTCIYMKGTSINSDNLTGTLIAYKSDSYVGTNPFRCDLDLPYDIEEYNVNIYEWRCE